MAVGGGIWLLVGDASGKGVGAALFMAVTKTLFRAIAPSLGLRRRGGRAPEPGARRDNERAMFVTAFAARLDLATAANSSTERRPQSDLPGGGARRRRAAAGADRPALGAVERHTSTARTGCGSSRATRSSSTPTVSWRRGAARDEEFDAAARGRSASCRDVTRGADRPGAARSRRGVRGRRAAVRRHHDPGAALAGRRELRKKHERHYWRTGATLALVAARASS